MKNSIPHVAIGEVLTKSEEWIELDPAQTYQQVTIKLWGQGVVLRNEVTGGEIAASRRLKVKAGQFILSRIDARNGALGIVPEKLHGAVVSNDFPAFDLDTSRVLPDYLGWMIRTRDFVELCKAASEGTTNRVRLQEDRFLALQLSLPPLTEQRRIVARIEELAAKIEEARGLRREAVGELEALCAAAKRVHLGDPKMNSLGWPTAKLGDIAELRYGIATPLQDASDSRLGQPIIRMANISLDGSLDLTDLRYYSMNEAEKKDLLLRPGDLLLNWRSGSEKHVGKTALFDRPGEFTFASFLLRIRANEAIVYPSYLKIALNFMRSEGVFLDSQRFQVNTKLNASEFAEFMIMLPALPEQHRIVTYLDSLQAKVDALKALQAETQAELDALLPAVLDRAFKGEL